MPGSTTTITDPTKLAAIRKAAPPLTVLQHVRPIFPWMPASVMPLVPTVDPKVIDYVHGSGAAFEQVYPNGLATLRGIAPPLSIIGDSGGYVINPNAIDFVVSAGLAFGDIYPTPPRARSLMEGFFPGLSVRDPSVPIVQKHLDAVYAKMVSYPRGQLGSYVAQIKKAAPPLVITEAVKGLGGIPMKLRRINQAAVSYVANIDLPISLIYPNIYDIAHQLAPELVRKNGSSEINPDAISFVQTTGLNFATVYPNPPPWQSDWPGSKETAQHYAQLVGRPFDGPNGVYVNWHHESGGFNVGDFASDAVKTCGAVVGAGIHMVDEATGAIGDALGKIPILGAPLQAIWDESIATPWHVADDIAHGKQIDQALLDGLHRDMRDIHTLAPYIETVIAIVPGIGPVASGSIAAALALANGEPIDQVMIDAAAGAVPGGQIVKACYHAGVAVMTGKGDAASLTVDAVAAVAEGAGVPVPDAARRVIGAGASATVAIANGKKPDQAVMDSAIAELPGPAQATARAAVAVGRGENVADILLKYGPEMIKGLPAEQLGHMTGALTTGFSLGHAQVLQGIGNSAIGKSIGMLAEQGAKAGGPLVSHARELNDIAARRGYDVGAEMSRYAVTRFQVEATKRLLTPAEQIGYQMALGLHVSQVVYVPPSVKDPMEAVGYMIAHGIRHAKRDNRKAVLNVVAKNPAAAKGVKLSDKTIARAQRKIDWMRWGGVTLGTVLGAFVGGPPGAAIGAAFGATVDHMRHVHLTPKVSHGMAASHVAALTEKR